MNHEKACNILHLKINFTMKELKRAYHENALLHHPDKKEDNDTTKFNHIKEAYDYLKDTIESDTNNTFSETENYENLFTTYVTTMMQNKNIDKQFLQDVVENMITESYDATLRLLEKLSNENLRQVYTFINQYQDLLHVNKEFVEKLRELLEKRYSNYEIIVVNPNIDDLMYHNVYTMKTSDINDISNTIFIPLWHNELYYNNNIIVKCNPDISDHIVIERNNDIKVSISTNISDIWNNPSGKLTIPIGSKQYEIPIENLKIKKYQEYILYRKGIARIIESDMYDISQLSNIIVCITIK